MARRVKLWQSNEQKLPCVRGSPLDVRFSRRRQWQAMIVCMAFLSIANFPDRKGSKRKSPNDACNMRTTPYLSHDSSEVKSAKRNSPSPASRPRNCSIKGNIARAKSYPFTRMTPTINNVLSGSSSAKRICIYKASSSANGMSHCTGRSPRIISSRSTGRWRSDFMNRITVAA